MKNKRGFIAGILFVIAAMVFMAALNNFTKQYYDVNVSFHDSLGNIDSLQTYYMDGGKWHDASLIAGQTVNFRAIFVTVTGSLADTIGVILQTKVSGSSLVVNSDTNWIVGHLLRDTVTQGAYTFSSTAGLEWRWKVIEGYAAGGTHNRNNAYLVYDEWSTTVNAGPNMLHLGNK